MCDFLSGVLLPFRLSGTDNPFSSRLAALVVAVDGVGAGAGICAVSVFSGCWYQWCLRSVVVGWLCWLVVYVLLVVPAVVLFHAPGLYTVPDIL